MRLCALVVSLFPIVSFCLFFKKKDLLNPLNVYSVLFLVGVIIPILYYYNRDNVRLLSNSYLINSLSDDWYYFKHALLQCVSYHLVLVGLSVVGASKPVVVDADDMVDDEITRAYGIWGALFWFVGLLAFLLIMRRAGGLLFFLSHLQTRATFLRDLDLLGWLLPLAQYGCLLICYSRWSVAKKADRLSIILIVLTGLMCGLGGRKALFLLVAEAIAIYNYCIKRVSFRDLVNVRTVLLCLVSGLFFLIMPTLRSEGAFEALVANPTGYIQLIMERALSSFIRESYVPFYAAIVEFFDSHPLWFGKTYLGLLTAFIPSSLYANKPPVDDGTYFYSIFQGRTDIMPVMPFNQLNGSSYPPETFGSMYANFGVLGLLFGMILLGILYGLSYRLMKRQQYSLFGIIFYLQMILTFHLSTLRIVQLIECVAIMIVVTKTAGLELFSNRKLETKRSRIK